MPNLEEIVARNLQKKPRIHESVYIAHTAHIIGEVEFAENASFWELYRRNRGC